jgi:hypothetical protein
MRQKTIATGKFFTLQAIRHFVKPATGFSVLPNSLIPGFYTVFHNRTEVGGSGIAFELKSDKTVEVTAFDPKLKKSPHYFPGASRAAFFLSLHHFSEMNNVKPGTLVTLVASKKDSVRFYKKLPFFQFRVVSSHVVFKLYGVLPIMRFSR